MACAVSSDFAAVTSRYGLTQAQSTQGIATLAAQGGVATLSERSERIPQIADFISGRGKLRRTHDTGLKDLYRSAPYPSSWIGRIIRDKNLSEVN